MARERVHADRYAVDGCPIHFRFPFDRRPDSLNRTSGRHWGTKHKAAMAWRLEVRSVCGLPPAEYCVAQTVNGRPILSIAGVVRLVITLRSARRTGRRRARDRVNRFASVKPVEDALVHWGWLYDDDDADHGGFCDLDVLEDPDLPVEMLVDWELVRSSRDAAAADGVSCGGSLSLGKDREEKRKAPAGRKRHGRRRSYRRGKR